MSTESTFFDLLLTTGTYLIFVIVLLVALYLARRWRRHHRATGAATARQRGAARVETDAKHGTAGD